MYYLKIKLLKKYSNKIEIKENSVKDRKSKRFKFQIRFREIIPKCLWTYLQNEDRIIRFYTKWPFSVDFYKRLHEISW